MFGFNNLLLQITTEYCADILIHHNFDVKIEEPYLQVREVVQTLDTFDEAQRLLPPQMFVLPHGFLSVVVNPLIRFLLELPGECFEGHAVLLRVPVVQPHQQQPVLQGELLGEVVILVLVNILVHTSLLLVLLRLDEVDLIELLLDVVQLSDAQPHAVGLTVQRQYCGAAQKYLNGGKYFHGCAVTTLSLSLSLLPLPTFVRVFTRALVRSTVK